DRRQRVVVEVGAVAAGHRGIFDDGDRRVRIAQHLLRQRALLQQLGHVDLAARRGRCGGGRRRRSRGGRRLGRLRLAVAAGIAACRKQRRSRQGGERYEESSALNG